jgi:CRISPR-associated endonuclease/helicase Cas3
MNIILVSECTKNAAKYSRRILSKYARHVGRRTWIASITKEGLAYLEQELLHVANKNTAIACHYITRRTEIHLAWVVGSHKKFDSEGNFAFRFTENKDEKYRIELSNTSRQTIKFFSYLNKLAGLFHDVGKNFYYFQAKLIERKKGRASGDPIRHEYLSFLCFFYFFDLKKETYTEQLIGLKKNTDEVELPQLQSFLSNKKDVFHKLFSQSQRKFILIKVVSHLILSHHRLIDGRIKSGTIQLEDKKTYFNTIYDEINNNEKRKIFKCYQQHHFVLLDEKWKKQLHYIVENLITLLGNKDNHLVELIKDESLFLSVSHYILRPALIMADQRVSARQSKVKEEKRIAKSYTQQTALANLKEGNNNQNLLEHLVWVGQQSFKNNTLLWHSIFSRKRFYCVDASEKTLRPIAKSLSQFQWQNAAVNAIKKIDKTQSFAFFGVVMAKTGAGKTRANAKIMAALNTEMRFSTLLGLRTLTLQTLDEYTQHLGVKKQHVIGVIGDENSRALHEFDKQQEQSTLTALLEDEENINISERFFNAVDTPFPEELCFSNQRDTKLDTIIKIPILVATIDYMIQGIEASRSSKTRFLTRLMTSDLIIDEIDSYNQNDLMAIHKLIYLVGFYGKKVIISSATLPEGLIDSFYFAYSTGYQRFKQYADKENMPIYIGLFTHFEALNQVKEERNNANAMIPPFIDDFYAAIQKEDVKRRATVLDLQAYLHQGLTSNDPQHEKLAPLYNDLFVAAQNVHEKNHSVIDGIQISTGLIKFNNTVDAFNCARYLFNAPDLEQSTVVKIECYHARHFPIRRNYTEKVLSELLNRKKSNGFKHLAIVKNAIKEAKNKHKRQIIFLVVSTTIIEIGRDFDFDWGIIEPSSHWSIVQTVGRILRHRNKQGCDNVVLLSHSMKAVRGTENSKGYYAKPGPEQEKKNDDSYSLAKQDKNKSVEELFEYEALSEKIDASITLKQTAGNPIKTLENKHIQCFKENKEKGSLFSYLHHPLEYLSTFNTQQNPFRGKRRERYLYQQNEHYKWEYFDRKKEKMLSDSLFETVNLAYPSRCLLTKTLEAIEEEYAEKGIELKREIISEAEPKNAKKYNEFLGVL